MLYKENKIEFEMRVFFENLLIFKFQRKNFFFNNLKVCTPLLFQLSNYQRNLYLHSSFVLCSDINIGIDEDKKSGYQYIIIMQKH